MSAPLVSVCIGSYNRARYIRECLDSVFAQTYEKLEVIVVDNASTDKTVEIVASYGDKIRLIQRSVNSGVCSTTRNQAAGAARGALIAFLDSDDRWYPEKIARQVAFMQAHPQIPLCHTYCRLMDADSVENVIRHEGRIPPSGRYFEPLLEHCWITISTALMKSELYEECGPFQESLPYGHLGEDYEFFLKVAQKHDIGFIPEVLASYRKAGQGISGSDWKGYPEAFPFIRVLRKRKDIFGEIVSRARMNEVLWRSAQAGSEYWRDKGYGWRAAYFPAQFLCKRPFRGAAWAELGKSLYRALIPRSDPKEV
jgi:glycosyltransferase involved in cell wall biosynthesis